MVVEGIRRGRFPEIPLHNNAEEMAKTLNITKSAICEVEKGRHLVGPKMALKIAKKAQLSESQALRLCIQDQLRRDKIKLTIDEIAEAHIFIFNASANYRLAGAWH